MSRCRMFAGLMIGLGLLAVASAEENPCEKCVLLPDFQAGGPPCSNSQTTACTDDPNAITCTAGTPIAGTQWPAMNATAATCQPTAEPMECTAPVMVPWPLSECQETGQKVVSGGGCPQDKFVLSCATSRVGIGQVTVKSCTTSSDPLCQPQGGGS